MKKRETDCVRQGFMKLKNLGVFGAVRNGTWWSYLGSLVIAKVNVAKVTVILTD